MKAADIAAARAELVAKDDLGLAYFDALIAKHTHEVPDGLTALLVAALRHLQASPHHVWSATRSGWCPDCAIVSRALAAATPEACAALDAQVPAATAPAEVPEGLATRLRARLALLHANMAHGRGDGGRGETCECETARLVREATPERCATIDTTARLVELKTHAVAAEVAYEEVHDRLRAEVQYHQSIADAAEKRALALESELKALTAEFDASQVRTGGYIYRLVREGEIARQRELRLTDALDLLDETHGTLEDALDCLVAFASSRPAIEVSRMRDAALQRVRDYIAKIEAFTTAPTSAPEPAPDPRDAFVCFGLGAFTSGELATEQAEVFRQHLPGCAACRDGLETSMQLDALGGCQATGEQDPAELVTEERLTEVEARATAELTGDITASDAQQNYGPIMPVLLAKDARDLAAEVRRLRLGRGGTASGLDSNETGAESRHRREAEHELATDRLVEWCRWRARELPTASTELKEMLERYEATRPEESE